MARFQASRRSSEGGSGPDSRLQEVFRGWLWPDSRLPRGVLEVFWARFWASQGGQESRRATREAGHHQGAVRLEDGRRQPDGATGRTGGQPDSPESTVYPGCGTGPGLPCVHHPAVPCCTLPRLPCPTVHHPALPCPYYPGYTSPVYTLYTAVNGVYRTPFWRLYRPGVRSSRWNNIPERERRPGPGLPKDCALRRYSGPGKPAEAGMTESGPEV